ncbi:hypothetical protein KAS45_00945, partial [candidate division WOR-3 bacterium]|nr:hypothetical protein [candidate division WOR-3 bacterium]
RIQAVVKELSGERIDIIQWSKEPTIQVSRSLSPAKVKQVIPIGERHVVAVVPDDDYSKAIGKNGVNVDLASRLCEVDIEIKKVTEYEKDMQAKELAKMKIQDVDGLKPKLKKALIEKGYTNVFVVINAPVDELKFLLSLDDDAVSQLLETLKPKEQKESEYAT